MCNEGDGAAIMKCLLSFFFKKNMNFKLLPDAAGSPSGCRTHAAAAAGAAPAPRRCRVRQHELDLPLPLKEHLGL